MVRRTRATGPAVSGHGRAGAGIGSHPMVRRTLPLAVASLLLGACGSSFGAPDPASEQAEQVHDLWRWFSAAAVGVGVFVLSLIVYVLVRYRRRNDEVPRQNPYNVPVEIAYTVAPIMIVAVLFAFSVRTEQSVDHDEAAEPDHVVEVVGFQWQWQFRYPETGLVITGTPEDGGFPQLVLPRGRTTRLELATTDVIHSFWVPRFLTKQDLIPGVDDVLVVTPTELGVHAGECAEFCGLDHGNMHFTVRVVEPSEFDQWLEETRP
jgi:cytochrome c oxidase subunit 2